MGKILKFVLVVVALVVVGVGAFVAYVAGAGLPVYPVTPIDLRVEVTPARVQRGKAIASMLCAECHRDDATQKFTGRQMRDLPLEFGVAYSRNITQDPSYGIGRWSDGDIARLLRSGLRPSGEYVPPWMVKLPHASDEDIFSIIAYLRSNAPEVQPAQVANRDSQPTLLAKLLARLVFKPFAYPSAPITAPAKSDRVAYGRYLATGLLGCFQCHSRDFKSNDDLLPEKSAGFMAGGNAVLDSARQVVRTANITFDEETGIGKWTEAEFVRALKDGFAPQSRPLRYPMARYFELEDDDVKSIYAYLATVPKIRNPVERAPADPAVAGASEGSKIYHRYGCQGCHAEDGQGLCDLRQARVKYPSDEAIKAFIKRPQAIVADSKMPAWDGVIKDEEFTPLIDFVKSLAPARAGL